MKKKDDRQAGGCGGNCMCACGPDEKKIESCEMPKGGVALDKEGKCPCGKEQEDCCHKDKISFPQENEALHELCEPHNGKHVCGIESDPEKTAA